MHRPLGVAVAAASLLMASSAAGAVLYSNGACDCETSAVEIGSGFYVANSFTLTEESSIDQINFTSWASLSNAITGIDWAILGASPEDGGEVLLAGAATVDFTSGYLNSQNFGVYQSYFRPRGTRRVAAGTYWLQLGNATLSFGGRGYWDQNNGPSLAYSSALGQVGSEAFEIIGGPGIPEPSTWALMILGFGTAGAELRRRRYAS
jgi:hypothetical protein